MCKGLPGSFCARWELGRGGGHEPHRNAGYLSSLLLLLLVFPIVRGRACVTGLRAAGCLGDPGCGLETSLSALQAESMGSDKRIPLS